MPKKIFITGCAKTGTTLLLRMCYAFKDTRVMYRTGFNGHELTMEEFLNLDGDESFIIGKRLPPFVLSNVDDPTFSNQIDWIKRYDIGVINVIRDGRDVVLSDGNYVKPERWISSMEQRRKYSDVISMEVSYEELVNNPDAVQDRMIEEFGIEKESNFSDYPEYVPDWVYDWNVSVQGRKGISSPDADYGKRKVSNVSIGKDLHAYKDICTNLELDAFERELKMAGYT